MTQLDFSSEERQQIKARKHSQPVESVGVADGSQPDSALKALWWKLSTADLLPWHGGSLAPW